VPLAVSAIVTFVLLVAGALLAAAETAVLMLPAGRVHRLVEAERVGAPSLDLLAERRHRLRAVATLVGGFAFGSATLLGALAGATLVGAEDTLSEPGALLAMVIGALLGALVVHALAQALPRTLSAANPERIGLDTASVALAMTRVLYPLARVLGAPWKWAMSVASDDAPMSAWAVSPEWRNAGGTDEESEREEQEEALLEAVSDFAEKVVREVMVPRTDVSALPDTATAEQAIEMIARTGYTRLPVYHKSIDDVRGVLYAKDLLIRFDRADATIVAGDVARQPFYVPETKPVEELLGEMRASAHMAIVVDEYGGTAGLVTIEDLLEEIVGEIFDEYDRALPLVVDVGDGRYRVDARLPIDELNERFGTDIEADADTLGGLFTELAGHIPAEGESLELEGLTMTVDDLQGTRVCQVIVKATRTDQEETTDA